jgi:glycosyltransferase involved in cell wall biosynthesis
MISKQLKILINTPSLQIPGGVANHYLGLKDYWSANVKYNTIGGRSGIPGPLILFYDYVKFFFICLLHRYDAVLINPSLGSTALPRDAIFLLIANLLRIKTIIFIHGWDQEVEKKLDNNRTWFMWAYSKADAVIVLAARFKKKLLDWGITAPIYLSTTKVNDGLLSGFDISKKQYAKTILFLARVEKAKGIFITIDAFSNISSKHPESKLVIAGTGSSLDDAKKYVSEKMIGNVTFLGHVSGNELINTFVSSDIYLLPTSHGEGMPTSLLEAMAFGLPVITSPAGGIVDFFENEKMGHLVSSNQVEDYTSALDSLLSNQVKTRSIGIYNNHYATKHFLASAVSIHIQDIIRNAL